MLVKFRNSAENASQLVVGTRRMDTAGEIYQIADELRSVAHMGSRYAENPYDLERYRRVLSLSARLVAVIEERSLDDVIEEYEGNLSHITPFVGADAAFSATDVSS